MMLVLFSTSTIGQAPQYTWAIHDFTADYQFNPPLITLKQVVAAHKGKALWGTLQNNLGIMGIAGESPVYGSYKLSEIDTSGTTQNTVFIRGKVALLQAEADTAGNWYVLGLYLDTVKLANGTYLARGFYGPQSAYFLARFQAGTLQPQWLKPIGGDEECYTECFSMGAGGLYFPIDSTNGNATTLNRLNLNTGARTTLWQQDGWSRTSAIQVDRAGGIFITSALATASGISFNGTPGLPQNPMQRPGYIARYRSNGTLHWSHWFGTGSGSYSSANRSLCLGADNKVFISGPLSDSTSLAGHFFRKPKYETVDYLTACLDSNGIVVWGQQRPAGFTTLGSYYFHDPNHAVIVDTTLYLFCNTVYKTNWAGGVSTTTNNYNNGTLALIGQSAGIATSAQAIGALESEAQQIATDGYHVWITGTGQDSLALRFNAFNVLVPQLQKVPFLAMLKVRQMPVWIKKIQGAESLFQISPNPAGQTLTITSQKGLQYCLLDAAGSVVLSGTCKGGTESISVGNLPRGFYLLEGSSAGGRQVQRVVLE